MPRLARRIAGSEGTLDAAVVGIAGASLHQQPDMWREWGSRPEALHHLKQLWHVPVAGSQHETSDVMNPATDFRR